MNDKTEQKYIEVSPEGISPENVSTDISDPVVTLLTLEDVLQVASGTDANGFPLAAGALAIDQMDGDKETKENLFLEGAEYLIHANGGCVVLEVIFPFQSQMYYQRAYTICQEWLKEGTKEEEVLTLLLSPYLTNGCIHILFQGLAFVFGVPEENKRFRLILGFDHTGTMTFETEDIDYAYIVQQVQAEVQRQEKELMDDLEDAKKEEEEAIRENTFQYGEYIQKEYSSQNIVQTPEEEINQHNVRSFKNRRGIRIAKSEEDSLPPV